MGRATAGTRVQVDKGLCLGAERPVPHMHMMCRWCVPPHGQRVQAGQDMIRYDKIRYDCIGLDRIAFLLCYTV